MAQILKKLPYGYKVKSAHATIYQSFIQHPLGHKKTRNHKGHGLFLTSSLRCDKKAADKD